MYYAVSGFGRLSSAGPALSSAVSCHKDPEGPKCWGPLWGRFGVNIRGRAGPSSAPTLFLVSGLAVPRLVHMPCYVCVHVTVTACGFLSGGAKLAAVQMHLLPCRLSAHKRWVEFGERHRRLMDLQAECRGHRAAYIFADVFWQWWHVVLAAHQLADGLTDLAADRLADCQ